MDGKVYIWLIFVCPVLFLVYTWFHCRENHRSNAVNLSKNIVGIIVLVMYGALKYYISEKNRRKIAKNKFTQSLHFFLKLHKVCTEFTPGFHNMLTECKLGFGAPYPPQS